MKKLLMILCLLTLSASLSGADFKMTSFVDLDFKGLPGVQTFKDTDDNSPISGFNVSDVYAWYDNEKDILAIGLKTVTFSWVQDKLYPDDAPSYDFLFDVDCNKVYEWTLSIKKKNHSSEISAVYTPEKMLCGVSWNHGMDVEIVVTGIKKAYKCEQIILWTKTGPTDTAAGYDYTKQKIILK
jgi:hypothetical protein